MRARKQEPATNSRGDFNRVAQRRSHHTSDGNVEPAPPSAHLLSTDGCLTIRIPLIFARRSGRKRIITPDGKMLEPASHVDEAALVKAIARAYRWKSLLEEGRYTSTQDLAAAERVTPSFLARILRLTLLAPDIIESIMQNPKTTGFSMDALMQPFPFDWTAQRAKLIKFSSPIAVPAESIVQCRLLSVK